MTLPFPSFDPCTMDLDDIDDETYWEGFAEFIDGVRKSQGDYAAEIVAKWVTSEKALFASFDEEADAELGDDDEEPILDSDTADAVIAETWRTVEAVRRLPDPVPVLRTVSNPYGDSDGAQSVRDVSLLRRVS